MGWNRLKIVLAAVLVAANLLLLYLLGAQIWTSQYIPDASIQQVKTLLEKDGISVAEDALSARRQSLVIYSGEIGDTYYVDTAEGLSDSAVRLSFTAPGGVVFSMENGDRCVFEGGFSMRYEAADAASLLEGSGFYELSTEGQNLPESLQTLTSREERALSSAVEDFVAGVSKRAERQPVQEMSYEVRYCGRDAQTQVMFFVCCQQLRDTKIENLSCIFAVHDGKVIGMRGEWCFSEVQTTYSAQLYDQVNILYKVKDHIVGESTAARNAVTSLSLAYAVYYRSDSDLFYLIPMWHVGTDEGMTYILNAVNGALYTE